jgi:hypothetical protein
MSSAGGAAPARFFARCFAPDYLCVLRFFAGRVAPASARFFGRCFAPAPG